MSLTSSWWVEFVFVPQEDTSTALENVQHAFKDVPAALQVPHVRLVLFLFCSKETLVSADVDLDTIKMATFVLLVLKVVPAVQDPTSAPSAWLVNLLTMASVTTTALLVQSLLTLHLVSIATLLARPALNIPANVLLANLAAVTYSTLNVWIPVPLEPIPSMEPVNIVPTTARVASEATPLVHLAPLVKFSTTDIATINVPTS